MFLAYIRHVAMSAGAAVGPRQLDAVVQRGADGGMAPCPGVGVAAGHEELAAAGPHAGRVLAAARGQRQESQQHEVDQRQQQPVEERAGQLERKAAHEIGPRRLQERAAAGDRFRIDRDVGVEEEQDVPTGSVRELAAGVLLATPSGGKRPAADEPDAGIGRRQGLDDGGGRVAAVVVENDQFEIDAATGEHSPARPFDAGRLVPGRYEHRDPWRRSIGGRPGRAGEVPQVGGRQQGRHKGQQERHEGQQAHGERRHGEIPSPAASPPCEASKRSPRHHADSRRTQS
jgi:hypothetical protein